MVFYGMVFVCYAIHILCTFPVAAGHATQMPLPPAGSTIKPLMGKIFDHYVYKGFGIVWGSKQKM